MKSEIEKIIRLLNKSFDKGAWHGPTVREILAQVKSENVFNRLPNTHNIIELVAHMTTWRNYVTSRIVGNNDFTVSSDINFPSNTDWIQAVIDLEKSHVDLIKALENLADEKLSELVPAASHKYTFYTMLHGIIHHDLYHAGQIILINKATTVADS
jgi:hypothetical protein